METWLPLVLLLFFVALFVAAFGLWIWALVDCVTREPSTGNDKIVWLLLILFLQFIGAIIYLLVRRPQRIRLLGA